MKAAVRQRFSLERYLQYEREASYKHEFWYGEVVAMAGGTVAHSEVASAVFGALVVRLRGGPCRLHGSDMRIVTPSEVATYPDVAVYCGEVVCLPGTNDTATNPTVIVEVLSPSTRETDLGEKLEAYKEIPSLCDVLLVEVEIPRIIHHYRTPAGWECRIADGREAEVRLTGVQVSVPLAEVYAHTT